ncbi:ParE family toxin-like protein [Thiorhodovibrio winogradskyi]|uniref:ParE family toxin-like protein n=1 Tax=Thiorhodovibrio winogradskyi TaxID=77007 RepID=UPI002E28FD67|nr:hypothetical protein [Thiorhodovibrio winogradskyi]
MKHFATSDFWARYHQLPAAVRKVADKQFALLREDPTHPSLRLKRVGPFWSARVSRGYRALAKERAEGLVWFWIGPHRRYDQILAQPRTGEH